VETTKAHGRLEIRAAAATVRLNAHLCDWPKVGQVVRIERRCVKASTGEATADVAYAITSLPPSRASAARLADLVRRHWHIENRLHWVRDATMREDACRVRKGTAPRALAALRNLSLLLFRSRGLRNIAAALRRCAARPDEAIDMLSKPLRI
jgi:predicted transposase YbfD/YdcC